MKQRIALLADVHGNLTALKAVLKHAKAENITEYWFLGDLIMPGPGTMELFLLLDELNTTVFIKGNWEDCFLEALDGKLDTNDATDVYIGRLAKYQCENLDDKTIAFIRNLPMSAQRTVNQLKIGVSHNLPTKNYGGNLAPSQAQENFDGLFEKEKNDIAIYAHVHHQTLRYSSNYQLIINPGSIGQPFSKWTSLAADLRAQYAILEIDETGVAEVDFKKVAYKSEDELEFAKACHLPYLELYQEQLKTGKVHTHNHQILGKINSEHRYIAEVTTYFQ